MARQVLDIVRSEITAAYIRSVWLLEGDYECHGISRPWKSNKRNVSCIPEGVYNLELVDSPRFGKGSIAIVNVPDRSYILIHAANLARELRGCEAPGTRWGSLEGVPAVLNSRAALSRLKRHLNWKRHPCVRITRLPV